MAQGRRTAAGAVLVLVGALMLSGCDRPPGASTPTSLTLATGSTSGVYYLLGTSLAQIYTSRVPGVRVTATTTGASPYNVQALDDGTADIAFALGDVAYLAYAEGSQLKSGPHRQLRSMAVLYSNALQFVVLPTSRIRSLGDLVGTRLGNGVGATSLRRSRSVTVDLLMEAHGVDSKTVDSRMMSFDEIMSGLRAQTLDVGVVSAGYPVPMIEAAARNGLRFLPVDRDAVERVREKYPFFMPVVIPRNTYSGQATAIETVGMDNLLLCRQGLNEDLVYRLTRTLFESLSDLALAHPSARMIDPDMASATPIPLHAGAARYYRERGLLLF